MFAVISLFVVIVVSLLVVRVATVALALTGISNELARFQARSAFTGAGFTTTESEEVVHHPVRRRIIMMLMLLGNAGIVTAVSSLILSFVGQDPDAGWTSALWFKLLVLILGLTALWMAAHSEWLDRRLSRAIHWALDRFTDLEVRDYAGLLHLTGGYTVSELAVEEGDWLAGRSLLELGLSREGVLVLGVNRANGSFVGAPRGQTMVHPRDTLILYGRTETLVDLDDRRAGSEGNRRHVEAVSKQFEELARSGEEDESASAERRSEASA
ncbi:MAG: TrkA C-terminal domain-containing protein [Phycisphaerales bacterium]